MSDMIVLMQIGPVQSFIASARKVQDLAVGSTLLSNLAKAGVIAAADTGADMLFPVKNPGTNKYPRSVPHRFSFTVSSDRLESTVAAAESAIRQQWLIYADAVRDLTLDKLTDDSWTTQFDRQIKQWLQIVYAALPYDPDNHGTSYARVADALAARKAFREFDQVTDQRGQKCTLTGSQSALNLDWQTLEQQLRYPENILFNPGENLGSLALIKRLLPKAHRDFAELRFSDLTTIAGVPDDNPDGREENRYFAVLAMDGDRMGKALSGLKEREQHEAFSQKLATFADDIAERVTARHQLSDPDNGKDRVLLIYAGGDDVLALAPLEVILPYAEDLRTEFADHMNDYGLHVSAGIAISYYKAPLDIALQTARDAEKDAKENTGRNAVVIRETTHSGNIRDAAGKWEHPEQTFEDATGKRVPATFMNLMEAIRAHTAAHTLSSKLGYDLRAIHYEMVPVTPGHAVSALRTARKQELRRILFRRLNDRMTRKNKLAFIANLAPAMISLGESPACGWESLANRVIMARFLAQD
jgi:CRISPR-associated protein Cmr2